MRSLFLLLMFVAIGAASVAHAQPGLSTGLNTDGIHNANRIEENTRKSVMALREAGVEALRVQDFAAAEKTFTELLSRNPTSTDANFLMGVTKIGLKNWEGAKQFLEIAVKQEPKRPEPKGRLGVTYAVLNDMEAAKEQRAELASMERKCRKTCADAAAIAANLAMIDQALALGPK